MITALERLSQIQDHSTFLAWTNIGFAPNYNFKIADIQEVVALANQQPAIDSMRFEAAKSAMQGMLIDGGIESSPSIVAANSICYADALIAELQKPKQ